jgi:hypothetical protein
MDLRAILGPALLGLGLLSLALAGCGRYVNSDIIDPAQSREQLARDKALCRQLANNAVPPTYGMERHEVDPTIEAQADRYVANVIEDDAHQDVFSRCMRDRGWEWKR